MVIIRKFQKTAFMVKKLFTDLKAPSNRYKLTADLHSSVLGEHYFLFDENRVASGKDQKLIRKFDENGIPINQTYIDVTDKDFVYFPISIGQMGLSVFHTYLKTQSEQDKSRFLKFADWFLNNVDLTDSLGARWLTDVALPQYQIPGPWASAFAQARGISILLRAYQLTNHESYRTLAEKALTPFTKPVEDGGVTAFTQWGPFYEEYTASVPTLVLNGMIFSLCGIYDFVRKFPGNSTARKIFSKGVQTVKNILPEYNLGFWSRYNLCAAPWYPEIDPATIAYHRLHITQLNLLTNITADKYFSDYARIFQDQDNFLNALKMYLIKYQSLKQLKRI